MGRLHVAQAHFWQPKVPHSEKKTCRLALPIIMDGANFANQNFIVLRVKKRCFGSKVELWGCFVPSANRTAYRGLCLKMYTKVQTKKKCLWALLLCWHNPYEKQPNSAGAVLRLIYNNKPATGSSPAGSSCRDASTTEVGCSSYPSY